MQVYKSPDLLKRQIAISRIVSNDLATRLEKATGIKGLPDTREMKFNGTHNGFAKKKEAIYTNIIKVLSSERSEVGVKRVNANRGVITAH
jgi:catalase